ncbi:hypothetical protein ICD41_004521 [Salmonella enterica]|nr:hypothetical protein [Salmonella enterica]
MFAGKKSAQIREILISESAWEEMTCLFAPSLIFAIKTTGTFKNKAIPQPHEPHKSNNRFLYSDVMKFIESIKDKENLQKKISDAFPSMQLVGHS